AGRSGPGFVMAGKRLGEQVQGGGRRQPERDAAPVGGGRSLCCGRTYLATGMVDRAREEAERLVTALAPFAARGVPVIGLEPSCLFSLRDEIPALLKTGDAREVSKVAVLFEEFLAAEAKSGRLSLPLGEMKATAVLHGHCHQKAFAAMPAVQQVLKLVPGLTVETIDSSCCGMAGAFGYEAEHYEVSMKMAEAALLPAIRKAEPGAILVADGTSCRHQIHDGANRAAVHVVRVLEMALATE
ncbi:MAG: (Fe-S)-binding protein, partial [Oceanibaculum sp.]